MPQSAQAVIILEDNDDIAQLLSQLLNSYGATPVICKTAEEVTQAIESHKIALALLDIMLPGVDGRAVARALREKAITFPLYFMSGIQESDILAEDKALADAYLQKPFTIKQLRSLLDQALRKEQTNESSPDQTLLELMATIASERENLRRQQLMLRGMGSNPDPAQIPAVIEQIQNFSIRLDSSLARIASQMEQFYNTDKQ